jgi:2-isopropylmalate synthase
MNDVKLYDTTLRDGAQAEGISFTVVDKLRIAKRLDEIGIHYIEGGFGSNPKDQEFFREIATTVFKNSKIVAFGSTRRPDVDVEADSNIKELIATGMRTAAIFGKSWKLHVRDVLRTSTEENLRMIYESVKFLKSNGIEVVYDAEHFFDGYRDDSGYAMETILAAAEGDCDVVVLCDTNGGAITSEIGRVVVQVKSALKVPVGIHTHDDTGMAVASSIAALEAGCSHVQGTINGYGERCGNANLCSVIPILKLKLGINCISDAHLRELTDVSKFVSDTCNMIPRNDLPYVGTSAFAHKGGMHVNAVMKNPVSFEHVDPALVGNHRRILISELSGRTSILMKAKEIDLDLEKDTPEARKMLRVMQDLEHQGYQFEGAEGSFELLLRRYLQGYERFFELEGFRVIVEKREDNKLLSEATIKLKVDNVQEHTAAEGDGPVNALDRALRKALAEFYPSLSEMHLTDFKVRVIDQKTGTAARVRVLIQSQDNDDAWWTVGVSENIIEASWQALVDSVEYKLLKDKRKKTQ